MGAPISPARIIASVVFPSPGGPESRIWSADAPRDFAALNKTLSCSRTRCCPTNSSKDFGRSASSAVDSSDEDVANIGSTIRSLIAFHSAAPI